MVGRIKSRRTGWVGICTSGEEQDRKGRLDEKKTKTVIQDTVGEDIKPEHRVRGAIDACEISKRHEPEHRVRGATDGSLEHEIGMSHEPEHNTRLGTEIYEMRRGWC